VPDPSTLALMTRLAARLLPHAAARTGLHEPVNVHLVLTGPGGGTWDIAVGERPPDPVSIRIVADAAGFCRLAANRVTPADLDLHVTGDPGRVPAGQLVRPARCRWDRVGRPVLVHVLIDPAHHLDPHDDAIGEVEDCRPGPRPVLPDRPLQRPQPSPHRDRSPGCRPPEHLGLVDLPIGIGACNCSQEISSQRPGLT